MQPVQPQHVKRTITAFKPGGCNCLRIYLVKAQVICCNAVKFNIGHVDRFN